MGRKIRDSYSSRGGSLLKFIETRIQGAFIIDIEPIEDERGFFARTWCQEEFKQHGIAVSFVQCNISLNKKKGTLRGMHYQVKPHEESKLIRCTQGSLLDVFVDVRPDSPTYQEWVGVELTARSHRMVFLPGGLAHGFQTLEDETEVFYQMSGFYSPECARGIRWDDPSLKIQWPLPNPIVSAKDKSYPLMKR